MRIPLILSFILLLFQAASQPASTPHAFGISKISAFDGHQDTTIYSALQEIFNGDLPPSYVSVPMIGMYTRSIERVGPLILGEGMINYVLEGVMDQNFILAQGRRNNAHWQQTTRIAFKYAPSLRMTRDNSSNLLPTNQKVGFQVDKVLWDSYTRIFFTESRGTTQRIQKVNFFADSKPVHSIAFNFVAMHYSNGQPEGVYRSVDSARNDYIKGDFSTNLFRFTFTYNYYSSARKLFSINTGYQRDANVGGPFVFIPEQNKRYGRNRVVGFLQWRSSPRPHIIGLTKNVIGRDDGNFYRIRRMWEYRIRWEYEYILGDLSLFKRSRDYRFNWHLYLEGWPLRSRTLGYLIHIYRGRDYFNIRYDDIVWVAHAGLSFTINRYHNPRFHPDESIIGTGNTPSFINRQERNRIKKSL
jgi:hypothetical protein